MSKIFLYFLSLFSFTIFYNNETEPYILSEIDKEEIYSFYNVNPTLIALPLHFDFEDVKRFQQVDIIDDEVRIKIIIIQEDVNRMMPIFKNVVLDEGSKLIIGNGESFKEYSGFHRYINPDFIEGNLLSIEIICNKESYIPKSMFLDRIYGDFSNSFEVLSFGFGTAAPCMENIVCINDDEYNKLSEGVCRIVMVLEEGIGYCTGTLMNNTLKDETPYILSAYHCDFGYTPIYGSWNFNFDYQSSTCENPSSEPSANTMTGCNLRASHFESDVQLLELIDPIPFEYNVYYNGWNKSEDVPQSCTLIHHASGDIKKISLDYDPLVIQMSSLNWGAEYGITPAQHHFKSELDYSNFEPGSSGGALFNEDGLVVGQLNGGNPGCEEGSKSYYGRFFYSWDEGESIDERLKEWLDPLGVDSTSISGMYATSTISGIIFNKSFNGQAGTKLYIQSIDFIDSVITDASGSFIFDELEIYVDYTISVADNSDQLMFLNNSDLSKFNDYLLEQGDFSGEFDFLVGDLNQDNNITLLDAIILRQLMLGNIDSLPFTTSWIYTLDSDHSQFEIFNVNNLKESGVVLEILAIKMGDVD